MGEPGFLYILFMLAAAHAVCRGLTAEVRDGPSIPRMLGKATVAA